MYKIDKIYIYLLFISVFFISIFLLHFIKIDINNFNTFLNNCISNVNTFMSICVGFYLTSLSVLFSSNIIKEYNKIDQIKTEQRMIHTLQEYFKNAIYCSLFTIVFGFIMLYMQNFKTHIISIYIEINIKNIFFSLFIGIFSLNFIFIYKILKVFMNSLVLQAKR